MCTMCFGCDFYYLLKKQKTNLWNWPKYCFCENVEDTDSVLTDILPHIFVHLNTYNPSSK